MKAILFIICVASYCWGYAQTNELVLNYCEVRKCYVLTSPYTIDEIVFLRLVNNEYKEYKKITQRCKFYQIPISDIKMTDRLTVKIGSYVTLINLDKLCTHTITESSKELPTEN